MLRTLAIIVGLSSIAAADEPQTYPLWPKGTATDAGYENHAGDIPTISFVSFWVGLIQALELVASATGQAPAWTRSTHVWPFGLDNPRGIHPFRQDPTAGCPVGCRASAALQLGIGADVSGAASRSARH